MASELQLQGLIVDAVKAGGGFAFKSANRFLVGVPDLFVKTLNYPGAFFEVKQNPEPSSQRAIRLNVTPLQAKFLRDLDAAGQLAGVIAFLQNPKHRRLGMMVRDIHHFIDNEFIVDSSDYDWAPDRPILIRRLLNNYFSDLPDQLSGGVEYHD